MNHKIQAQNAAAFMQEVVVYLGAIDALKLLWEAIASDPNESALALELHKVRIRRNRILQKTISAGEKSSIGLNATVHGLVVNLNNAPFATLFEVVDLWYCQEIERPWAVYSGATKELAVDRMLHCYLLGGPKRSG
jgi:hypothetical protein